MFRSHDNLPVLTKLLILRKAESPSRRMGCLCWLLPPIFRDGASHLLRMRGEKFGMRGAGGGVQQRRRIGVFRME
ncbi:hypothetical protein ACP90_05175 [Labrenzia sp. CP4]|nr:hypothetical protein ACP90_05175 [Labrenzia sp. CP4]